MSKTMSLLFANKGMPRTVEAVRAKAALESRVLSALRQQWTLSRIMAKYRVQPGYVRGLAEQNGLTVERPSDNWVGRP